MAYPCLAQKVPYLAALVIVCRTTQVYTALSSGSKNNERNKKARANSVLIFFAALPPRTEMMCQLLGACLCRHSKICLFPTSYWRRMYAQRYGVFRLRFGRTRPDPSRRPTFSVKTPTLQPPATLTRVRARRAFLGKVGDAYINCRAIVLLPRMAYICGVYGAVRPPALQRVCLCMYSCTVYRQLVRLDVAHCCGTSYMRQRRLEIISVVVCIVQLSEVYLLFQQQNTFEVNFVPSQSVRHKQPSLFFILVNKSS